MDRLRRLPYEERRKLLKGGYSELSFDEVVNMHRKRLDKKQASMSTVMEARLKEQKKEVMQEEKHSTPKKNLIIEKRKTSPKKDDNSKQEQKKPQMQSTQQQENCKPTAVDNIVETSQNASTVNIEPPAKTRQSARTPKPVKRFEDEDFEAVKSTTAKRNRSTKRMKEDEQ